MLYISKICHLGEWREGQRFSTHVSPAGDLSSVLSTHVVAHNHPENSVSSDLCRSQACTWYIYIHAGKAFTYVKQSI